MSLAASNGHFWLMHNSPSLILAHQQKCHYLEKNPNSLPRSNWYNVAWLIMVSYFLLISLSLSLSLSLAAFVNCLLWQKRRVTISLFLISFPLGGLNATLPLRELLSWASHFALSYKHHPSSPCNIWILMCGPNG